MKLGRNDPCSCGSGKKYKHCCMDSISKLHSDALDHLTQTAAMNPNITIEELNLVMQQKMIEQNNRANPDFFGLSPTQIHDWLYAPFNNLPDVKINTPEDLSSSPVMRYLALIIDEAMLQDGSFKATSKGNLPTKLVKQASELLPEFAIAPFNTDISISEYAGSNEDKFNALHYTRVLAEIAGIIYRRSGCFHIKKTVQKQYKTHGLNALFLPMLEAAVTKYNWAYLDILGEHVNLRPFWLFMLWRLQSHGSIDKLIEEVSTAFPELLRQFPTHKYASAQEQLSTLIESRFIERFLQFWGFVTVDPKLFFNRQRLPKNADILPLLKETFSFAV